MALNTRTREAAVSRGSAMCSPQRPLCTHDAADWSASGAAPWWPLQIYDGARLRMYDAAELQNGCSNASDAAYLVHAVYGPQPVPWPGRTY